VNFDTSIEIGGRTVALESSAYFIADIASNHDADLDRAIELINLAAESGADAVKFQHFLARGIVSDRGFRELGTQRGHQSNWSASVYETYEQYELERGWMPILADAARNAGVTFMSTPYDREAIKAVRDFVPAFKIGSGDITWTSFLDQVAREGKPVILATGASSMADVDRAVETILRRNPSMAVLQCNTNYTGDASNFRYSNLNVLTTFSKRWPGMVLGLSDHTPGHAVVLGAIALGARIIEKHFTDDNDRDGPDHMFSLNPAAWREMIGRSRELEAALGDGEKRVEANETETFVIQRRALHVTRDLAIGTPLAADDLESLRPAPSGSYEPYRQAELIGRRLEVTKLSGQALFPSDLESR
jgi:N-acetylneuraminate synthase